MIFCPLDYIDTASRAFSLSYDEDGPQPVERYSDTEDPPTPIDTIDPTKPNTPWGTQFYKSTQKDVLTIMHQNIYRYPDDPYVSLANIKDDFRPDVLCLNELSLNLTGRRVTKIYKDIKSCWDHSTISLSHTRDTFLTQKYKPGGVAVVALGQTTASVITKGDDPLGRWAWISLACRGSITLTVITLYRPYHKSLTTAGPKTYYMQLYRQHIHKGAANTINPRQQIVYDFAEFLSTFPTHQLIVTMDANESTTHRDSTSIFDYMEELGLESAYHVVTQDMTTLPKTYLRGLYIASTIRFYSEYYHPPVWLWI